MMPAQSRSLSILGVRARLRAFARELNEISGRFGLFRLREPILLPQRLRVLAAAKRVERVGGDAGVVFGPIVVPPKDRPRELARCRLRAKASPAR